MIEEVKVVKDETWVINTIKDIAKIYNVHHKAIVLIEFEYSNKYVFLYIQNCQSANVENTSYIEIYTDTDIDDSIKSRVKFKNNHLDGRDIEAQSLLEKLQNDNKTSKIYVIDNYGDLQELINTPINELLSTR